MVLNVCDIIDPPSGTQRLNVTEDLNERRIAVKCETRLQHGDRKQTRLCVQ